jgi:RNA 2',3'-cyclic 3'-phosphodiesterase
VGRLFFALWPDEAAARALAALAASLAGQAGGKPVPLEKIHMTLAFLGPVAEDRRAHALEAAARLRPRAFELILDRVGAFRRAGVAWAGTSSPPERLLGLQSKLEARLRERGFGLEDRPYTPHVTLARRIERAVPRAATARIVWTAREFTLVRSETASGRYVVERRWDLRD